MIRFHQSRVAADPDDPLAHNRLAAAYVQKARESGDLSLLRAGREGCARSLTLLPRGAPAAARPPLLAAVHLARHEFTDRPRARAPGGRPGPGRAGPHAVAGDALIELGDYEAAAQAYARIAGLDGPRRPDAAPGVSAVPAAATRAAPSRGMRAAVALVTLGQSQRGEPTAWARAQLGDLLFHVGDLAGAERRLSRRAGRRARLSPRRSPALARVRAAQGR